MPKKAQAQFAIPGRSRRLSRGERAILSLLRKNLNEDHCLTIPEIAERTGLSEPRTREIMKSVKFAIDGEAAHILSASKLQRMHQLSQKAVRGSVAALKLSFQMDGSLAPDGAANILTQNNVTINLNQARKDYDEGRAFDLPALNALPLNLDTGSQMVSEKTDRVIIKEKKEQQIYELPFKSLNPKQKEKLTYDSVHSTLKQVWEKGSGSTQSKENQVVGGGGEGGEAPIKTNKTKIKEADGGAPPIEDEPCEVDGTSRPAHVKIGSDNLDRYIVENTAEIRGDKEDLKEYEKKNREISQLREGSESEGKLKVECDTSTGGEGEEIGDISQLTDDENGSLF